MTRAGKLLRLVSWFEILAGAFMLIDVLAVLFGANASALATLNKGWFIVLGVLSLAAGIALRRCGMPAWRASVAVQLLHMPVLLIGSLWYRPGLGAFVPVGVYLADLQAAGAKASALFEFSVGVDFAVSFAGGSGPGYIAVNLAAFALLLVLLLNRPGASNLN